jgi:hypothetical protein
MLSSVLNSRQAVEMNILLIRVFIKLREVLATHKDWPAKSNKWKPHRKTMPSCWVS